MNNAKKILNTGGIGIIATDTLYGIVGQALKPGTVQRIYEVKERTPTKPFIILISGLNDLKLFDITLNRHIRESLEKYWPGPVSIIVPCINPEFEYLHRGTNTLAFRMPAKPNLIKLISSTGPLVAPSANPEGLEPASDINAAMDYFGENVDFYLEGSVSTKPSKVIKLTNEGEEIIRP